MTPLMSSQDAKLPSGWNQVELRDLVNAIRGVSFPREAARLAFEQGTIPILRAGNISAHLETGQDLVWVPENFVSDEQKLRVNDIVICLSSGSPTVVGKTAKLNSAWFGSVGAFCAILRASSADTAAYLAYWFRGHQFTTWRDSQARGANIQNLRINALLTLQISLPPLAEQKRIVGVLNGQLAAAERAKKAAEDRLEAARAVARGLGRQRIPKSNGARMARSPFGRLNKVKE